MTAKGPASGSLGMKWADLSAAIDTAAERYSGAGLVVFSLGFALVCVLLAATKLLWYDELLVYYVSRLPIREILEFHRNIEPNTPVAPIAVHASIGLFGDNAVTVRLPSIAGFLVMCICIYRFISRRCPLPYAWAGMVFPAVSGAMYYSTEGARPYGMILGCTGIALVCWQAATENKWRGIAVPGLFFSLAAALSLHYFSAFLWIPFGLAELTRTWVRRRIDVPVWLALLLSPSVIFLFLAQMGAARAAFAGGIWAKPGLGTAVDGYRSMLTPAFTPILVSALLYFLLARRYSRPDPKWIAPPVFERVLVVTLALTPVVAGCASYVLGTYVFRYTLYAIVGVAISMAFAMCYGFGADRLAAIVVLASSFCWFTIKSAATVRHQVIENGGLSTPLGQPLQGTVWMRAIEPGTLPIVASPAVFFVQLQQYAPAQVRERVIYPGDDSLAMKYDGMDTGEKNLFDYSRRMPIAVEQFDSFVQANKRFLLIADTTNSTWHLPALIARGAELRLITRSDTHFIFDVTLP